MYVYAGLQALLQANQEVTVHDFVANPRRYDDYPLFRLFQRCPKQARMLPASDNAKREFLKSLFNFRLFSILVLARIGFDTCLLLAGGIDARGGGGLYFCLNLVLPVNGDVVPPDFGD